jgi:hypothetical protein
MVLSKTRLNNHAKIVSQLFVCLWGSRIPARPESERRPTTPSFQQRDKTRRQKDTTLTLRPCHATANTRALFRGNVSPPPLNTRHENLRFCVEAARKLKHDSRSSRAINGEKLRIGISCRSQSDLLLCGSTVSPTLLQLLSKMLLGQHNTNKSENGWRQHGACPPHLPPSPLAFG